MQTSSLRRQMKNVVNNYTEAEIKVREATSNDPWGPPTSLMAEIADLTFNVVAIAEVMGMLWKRLNDHGKNWRHVYKALTLMDYLVKTGSEQVAKECKEKIYSIQTLRDFQYLDRDGRDQGINVREKAKQLVALLRDEEKLKKERSQALKTKTRMAGVSSGLGSMPPPYPGRRTSHPAGAYGDEPGRCRRTSSPLQSSSSSSRLAPDIEQARPQTSGEEELQLQLALAMSREESEKPPPPTVDIDEQTQLQIAMSLSKEDSKKPSPRAPTNNVDLDDDAQLQLALNLSKQEHQQEQLTRQGDESMLNRALEESKREMEAKGGTAFMDLVDIFAPSRDPHSSLHQAAARGGGRDPWDSLDEGTNLSRPDSPWMAPPSSPPPPWEPYQASIDPWDTPLNNVPASNSRPWASSGSAGVDPFAAPSDQIQGAGRGPSPRTGSPSDGDLFDEAMDGGKVSINGRGDAASPELFDLTNLRENLPLASNSRTCRTPESFLDPAAASLVNLDSLIPVNEPKNKNPFLSGLSAPSANNPFQTEQPKLTLNQMGSGLISAAPNNASLPYSASLPLPLSHQPASLPSSFTHPTQPGLDLLGTMPEPLLPLSGSMQASQASQANQNPFL
ncbi:epsin-3 isoform X1 [Periophthalmus magnuspinnatus]|uniref:epsin-3 isoform X1 n=1 Tax=Periophthalmus magnuspinnatus TaxID=409849 RepID=UPI00145BFC67|nr:epsin-3 isoform X1 [Periophthalmus magnuspinnatus]